MKKYNAFGDQKPFYKSPHGGRGSWTSKNFL